jgi:hypothetical protein
MTCLPGATAMRLLADCNSHAAAGISFGLADGVAFVTLLAGACDDGVHTRLSASLAAHIAVKFAAAAGTIARAHTGTDALPGRLAAERGTAGALPSKCATRQPSLIAKDQRACVCSVKSEGCSRHCRAFAPCNGKVLSVTDLHRLPTSTSCRKRARRTLKRMNRPTCLMRVV